MAKTKEPSGNTVRKRPLGERFIETVFKGTVADAKNYILNEVLIPKATSAVLDAVSGGLERLIHGGQNPSNPYTSYYGSSMYGGLPYVSYNAIASTPSTSTGIVSTGNRIPQVVDFVSEDAARKVYYELQREIIEYKSVSIASYYYFAQVADQMPLKAADKNYGWRELPEHPRIQGSAASGKYNLILPPTVPV